MNGIGQYFWFTAMCRENVLDDSIFLLNATQVCVASKKIGTSRKI
jgi:hypothetical protein